MDSALSSVAWFQIELVLSQSGKVVPFFRGVNFLSLNFILQSVTVFLYLFRFSVFALRSSPKCKAVVAREVAGSCTPHS